MTCPFCGNKRIAKAGYTNAGSQRFRCHRCKRRYVVDSIYAGYREDEVKEAISLKLSGMSVREVSREIGVNHQSVANWLSSGSSSGGFVYLMHSLADGGLYKIGKTKYIETRLSSLITETRNEIKLIHSIQSNSYDILERVLHEKFRQKRVKGEWFNLSTSDIEYIKSL